MGSWFIDLKKYHTSAHGQLSCLDCHEEISGQALHPDPSLVKRSRSSFFEPDTCIACHDNVPEDLAQGRHGQKQIKDRAKYKVCIKCHKVHYQPRLGENPLTLAVAQAPKENLCSACHEPKDSLPPPSPEEDRCISCHAKPDTYRAEHREKVKQFCLHCHAEGENKAQVLTATLLGGGIRVSEYAKTPHADLACISCHPRGASFSHHSQPVGSCLECHSRHREVKAHDAHLRVACQSCHLNGVFPVLGNGSVLWELKRTKGVSIKVHQFVTRYDERTCRRCHFEGNEVGASALVLPPKGIACLPCHNGTFSIGGVLSRIGILIFGLGVIGWMAIWFGGWGYRGSSRPGSSQGGRDLFSTQKLKSVARALVLDVLLQRRLYLQSKKRWTIHALIFWGVSIRCLWGMAGLMGSVWTPESDWVWTLLDRNSAIGAFFFDLTGMMILAGTLLALGREALFRSRSYPATPPQDLLSLLILAAIVIVGFFLEGIRIAMQGVVGEGHLALAGLLLSGILKDMPELTVIHGVLWYVHAAMVAGFVAYIPFSRLFHIILAPVVIVVNATKGHQ